MDAGVLMPRRAGNGRWALVLVAVALAMWAVCLWLLGDDGGAGADVARVLLPPTVLVSTVALVWATGEAHLRWSPTGGPARALVGWLLALACLVGCLVLAFWGLLIWLYVVGA